MADETADVVILGGGPAGAATAIELARRGVDVVLLERTNYDGPRIGEMLPPEANQWLQRLDVWEAFERDGQLPSPGVVFAWATAVPEENDFIFNPYGDGWHLDRARFDAMLASEAENAGAEVVRGARVRDCRPCGDRAWQVSAVCHGAHRVLCGSFLVDATGRSAWLAQRQGVRRVAVDQLVGVVGHLQAPARCDQRLLVEAFANGWWYSGPLPGGRAVAVCMTDADFLPQGRLALRDFWNASLREAPLTAAAIGGEPTLDELRTVSASTSRLEAVHGPGWLAVGDAAVSYDPLAARGITKAMQSAAKASSGVARWLRGRGETFSAYSEWVANDFRAYCHHYREYYGQARRWPNSLFWQRRTSSHSASSGEFRKPSGGWTAPPTPGQTA